MLAEQQDLSQGTLSLLFIPGRIKHIRFAEGTSSRANLWNAMPAQPGDLLNLRDMEQAVENIKRVPTAEADFKITPAMGADAKPGEGDVVVVWKQSSVARLNLSMAELTFTPVDTKVPRDARGTGAGKQGRETDVGGYAQACMGLVITKRISRDS